MKQAGCFGFVFPREFSSLFRVSRGRFVLLRGTSAAWRHRESSSLLCSRCSVVLRHWHGPRLHKWLVVKVRVQRTGARWRAQLRGVSEMFKPCSRESESQKRREERAHSRVVLNSPTWPCPRAACRIRLSVWGGAPPMSRLSGGGSYVVRHSSHSVEDTNLQILYACLVTHDAKA